MKKIGKSSFGAIICVLLLIASMASAVDLSNEKENENIEINDLSYTFLFKEPESNKVRANNLDFASVGIDGCIAIAKNSGDPAIAAKPVTLLLPPMKEVSNVKINGNPIELDIELPIIPYQEPVPFGHAQGEFKINNEVYAKDTFYPGRLKDDYSISYSHGYTIFNIVLNPMQYNPVKAKVEYYPEMTIEIELEDTSEMNQFYRNNPKDEAWVENLVYNPDITDFYKPKLGTSSYPGGICNPTDDYDYVIITTEHNDLDYWDTTGNIPYNWDSLMDKHESDNGLSCTLVTIQEIENCDDYQGDPPFNDQQAHIREFCKDAYEDWDTSYILIGGDDEWIPARHMKTNYEGNIDSDIYWSNLDNNFNADQDNYWGEEGDSGFDVYSEIFIGRVTCDEPKDVSNWLTKSFYYADNMEEEFLKYAGFYGGNTGWNCQGDDFMDYSAIKGTDDWLGPNPGADGPFPTWAGFQYGFETWNDENPDNQYDISEQWTAEPPNPGWQGGSESAAINGFKTAINNNRIALASGIAHANADMSLDVYSSSWESDYHNTKPFFLHDFGCHCGDMDASNDGVLHSMLFHSDTELAFGVVYNTCYGWGNFDTTNSSSAFQAKEFWSYFLDFEKSGDFLGWEFGKGHAFSKDRMAPTLNWDAQYGTWRAIIQGCLLFGDPAQRMKSPHPSEPPMNPTAPNGPPEWVQNIECEFTASTTDPENDQIFYLFDWGDGTMSEWLGPYISGNEIEAEHQWSDLGTYEIKLRARDIWGAISDWSNPHVLEIIENSPPSNPTIEGPKRIQAQRLITYTISAADPDNHDVYYMIDWDDGGPPGMYEGPYASGEKITFTNSWSTEGSYTIKAKAMDFIGDKSGQTNFDIVVTKSRSYNNQLLLKIFEQIIDNFPILKQILQSI